MSQVGHLNHVTPPLVNTYLKTEFNLEKRSHAAGKWEGSLLGLGSLGLESNHVRNLARAFLSSSRQEEPSKRTRTHLDSIVQYWSVMITSWT